MSRSGPPLFVLADVHGHRAELRAALEAGGLVDRAGTWCGADARLWMLGDYVDRGPDGTGVIEDIWRLMEQAAADGGRVSALLGNHEAQILAAYRFGDAPVAGWDEPGGFRGGWARFGGRESDLQRLTGRHVAWIEQLPVIARADSFLLVHSDTARYLELGSDVDAVNAAARAVLVGAQEAAWLNFCDVMSDRGGFRAAEPARADDAVSAMLAVFGGMVLVHGHSTLTKYFGVAPGDVREAFRYADGRVVNVDGGVYEGGRILLTQLA